MSLVGTYWQDTKTRVEERACPPDGTGANVVIGARVCSEETGTIVFENIYVHVFYWPLPPGRCLVTKRVMLEIVDTGVPCEIGEPLPEDTTGSHPPATFEQQLLASGPPTPVSPLDWKEGDPLPPLTFIEPAEADGRCRGEVTYQFKSECKPDENGAYYLYIQRIIHWRHARPIAPPPDPRCYVIENWIYEEPVKTVPCDVEDTFERDLPDLWTRAQHVQLKPDPEPEPREIRIRVGNEETATPSVRSRAGTIREQESAAGIPAPNLARGVWISIWDDQGALAARPFDLKAGSIAHWDVEVEGSEFASKGTAPVLSVSTTEGHIIETGSSLVAEEVTIVEDVSISDAAPLTGEVSITEEDPQ